MWIKTTNTDSNGDPVTRSLGKPGSDGDDDVQFSDNCKAQVTREVGEELISRHETVEPVEGDDDSDDGDDDSDATLATYDE